MKALLALEDGRLFACQSFTGPGETCGEIVFNTSMTGFPMWTPYLGRK